MLIPWSAFWDRNIFLEWSSTLSAVMTNNYVRGAITGLGLINVWAALGELGDLFGSKPPSDPQSRIDPNSDFRNPQ